VCQEYLVKRVTKKLQEMEDEVLDAEFLFDGVDLTDAEKADIAYKKTVLGT
jgi:pre-mRNA-splicing factor ATP-dependent RNA helicase DHX16